MAFKHAQSETALCTSGRTVCIYKRARARYLELLFFPGKPRKASREDIRIPLIF